MSCAADGLEEEAFFFLQSYFPLDRPEECGHRSEVCVCEGARTAPCEVWRLCQAVFVSGPAACD